MAICHPADLLTGLIMYKGLFIHLSVWIYKSVGRYLGGRWQDIYTFTYICGYLPIHRPTSNPEYTYRAFILACIYIDLYGYTDSLIHIRSAGWQLDMYMFIYINGYLPICQLICHPEYI